ncbi:hypothetical protein V5799_013553 [Amblyomma americanum]|uniref:DDE-1 domain-containing protein n=1 Tax=Amblyomma americanum TaxID=6943 RepID=A0AAQ4E5Q4_AMBAM
MDGSCKLRPFVIGKSKSPRCFKNCKQLPVRYGCNRKAWMTRQLFVEWLQAWDAELGKSGRRVCLLVDNCSAHQTTCKLQHIELKFLPPNTTARLQPLDQGIIKAFKVGYRKRLIQRLLINLRMGTDLKIDLLGAIQMITGAWGDVKQATVANCFGKAGLEVARDECPEALDDDEYLEDAFRDLSNFSGTVPPEVTVDDFINADSEVQAVADLADEDIVAGIAGVQDSDSSDNEGNCVFEETRPCTATELASAFSLIRRCCGEMEGTGLSHLDSLEKIETSVLNFISQRKKQPKISDFFSVK